MSKVFVQMRAYNAEAHIERAIASVMMQDYPEIELIILDDGSTDKTPAIIRERMIDNKTDKMIYSIKQENKGPAGAFKRIFSETLKRASDEDYIFTLDSDDFYTRPDAISRTVARMQQTQANVCIIGVQFEGDKQFILQPGAGAVHKGIVDRLAQMDHASNINESPFMIEADTTLWSKVYKKPSLEKYVGMLPEFPADLQVCEDFPTILPLLFKDTKVTSLPEVFYGFYKRSDSVTSRPTVANFERDRIQFLRITDQIVNDNSDAFVPSARDYVTGFLKKKFEVISNIIDLKVSTGDLPVSYSKSQFQDTFRRTIRPV